ncbi:MAG: hypothetical protein ACRCWJ_14975 [Casimicrobium sp.]
MSTPHKHAAVLIGIANGKKVQFRSEEHDEWADAIAESTINPISWPDLEWRIAIEEIQIGPHRVPKPLTVSPAIRERCWCISGTGVCSYEWEDRGLDREFLEAGLLFATKDEAAAAYDFWVKARRGEIDFSMPAAESGQ